MDNTNIFSLTINKQQELLFQCLNQFLKQGDKVALLDFPNHNNVGDNAIWLGEKAALKKMGIDIVYQCDLYSFSEKALRKHLPKEGKILLHGGGNLGTVWPEHQMFREKIIKLFPEYQIIQLPQSVFFQTEEPKHQFGNIGKEHKGLKILVRDKVSYDLLNGIGLNVQLCPDMAFAIGAVPSSNSAKVEVIWLSRTDHESVSISQSLPGFKTEKLDWLLGEPGRFYSNFTPKFTVRVRRFVQMAYRNSFFLRDHLWRLNTSFFDMLAWSRFNRGVRILSRGKVVVTDRLHGHIISTLIGKPQVLLDNHYNKIGNYIDCFESPHSSIFYLGNDMSRLESSVSDALGNGKTLNKE